MNRGRRRGGGPSLSGLRDGVKRRLFDPNSVPTKLDAKFQISRLIPCSFAKPIVHTSLYEQPDEDLPDQNNLDNLYRNLFPLSATIDYVFECGPFRHPLPVKPEGVDLDRILGKKNSASCKLSYLNLISNLHLLLAHDELSQWSDTKTLFDLEEPDECYPPELLHLGKKRKLSKVCTKSLKVHPKSRRLLEDIDEPVPDQVIRRITEDEDENEEKDITGNADDNDADSEDARWNGDVNQDGDIDELDDDEFDNDYCQTYFDNGERDISDDDALAGGDDDDDGAKAKYYD